MPFQRRMVFAHGSPGRDSAQFRTNFSLSEKVPRKSWRFARPGKRKAGIPRARCVTRILTIAWKPHRSARSEERRVGKECRSGSEPYEYKKKNTETARTAEHDHT